MKTAREIMFNIHTKEDKQRVAAIFLYRVNKAIKYVMKERSGLAFKFYHLKELYLSYFYKEGFAIPNTGDDKNMYWLGVHDIELKMHAVKSKRNRFFTTTDISHKDEETTLYIEEIEIGYELLVFLAEELTIDTRYKMER